MDHNHRMKFLGGNNHTYRYRSYWYRPLKKKRNGLFRCLQQKLLSSQAQLQTCATTQLNRIKTTNAVVTNTKEQN